MDDFASDDETLETLELIKSILIGVIIIPLLSLNVSIVVVRLWLLYFDMRLNNYLKNKQWRDAIEQPLTPRAASHIEFGTNDLDTGDELSKSDNSTDMNMKALDVRSKSSSTSNTNNNNNNSNNNHNKNKSMKSFKTKTNTTKLLTETNEWTIEHRDSYGNGTYLFKFCICIAFGETLIFFGLLFLTGDPIFGTTFMCIMVLCKGFVICWIWRLINHLDLEYSYDSLGIRKEMFYLLIFFVVAPILGVLFNVLRFVTNDHWAAVLAYSYYLCGVTLVYVCLGVPMMKKLSSTSKLSFTQRILET